MTQIVKSEVSPVYQTQTFDADKVALIKRTIAKDATNDELAMFLHQCERTGLDPFSHQIYFVSRWSKKENRKVGVIQVGIDGFRAIADRTQVYAGNDDPVFTYDQEDVPVPGEQLHLRPFTASVTVWKIVQGQRCSFTASARWDEYYPDEKEGFMWDKLPHLMLGKTAEALALRKGFPMQLSGLYIPEEMEQAGPVVEGEARVIDPPRVPKAEPPKSADRPLPPEEVKRVLHLKAQKKASPEPATEKQVQLLNSMACNALAEVMGSADDSKPRHLCLSWLWDNASGSAKDLSKGQASVTIDWLIQGSAEGKFELNADAQAELLLIFRQAQKDAGQAELPITKADLYGEEGTSGNQ